MIQPLIHRNDDGFPNELNQQPDRNQIEETIIHAAEASCPHAPAGSNSVQAYRDITSNPRCEVDFGLKVKLKAQHQCSRLEVSVLVSRTLEETTYNRKCQYGK